MRIKKDKGRIYLRPSEQQRLSGKRQIRLYNKEGTPEFDQELKDAQEIMGVPTRKQPKDTLRWLIRMYYLSPEYNNLGPSTKKVRQGLLEKINLKLGNNPYRSLVPRHIRAFRDSKQDVPESANSHIKALRQVYKWAINADFADHNPALSVPYLPSKNPNGFHTWTETEIKLYENRHEIGTKARLALGLLLYTGVRRSDAVQLGPQNEKNGCLEFTEAKNRARYPKARVIPILQPLRQILDATPTGHLVYLVTEFGKPFTFNGFGNWFKRRCREADVPKCSAHGLRKAGAVRAAMNGATTKQLMAMFGWRSAKMAELYTKQADEIRTAKQFMHLLTNEEYNQNSNLSHMTVAQRQKP